MDETQIAEMVSRNIPRDVTPGVVEAPPMPESEPEDPFTNNLEYQLETNSLQLTDYFAIDRIARHQEDTKRQLRQVFTWAAERAGTKDIDKVFSTLRVLEAELGISWKPNRLQRLARWIELEKQTQAFRAQQEMITHG